MFRSFTNFPTLNCGLQSSPPHTTIYLGHVSHSSQVGIVLRIECKFAGTIPGTTNAFDDSKDMDLSSILGILKSP